MNIQGREYEHTLALPTSEAAPIRYRATELAPLIQTILKGEPFDAGEFSLAGYIMLMDREEPRFRAIPVFPARSFFHSCLWVRRDSPLRCFEDLVGKRIALRDYTSTTSVWFRGCLKADHGADWAGIEWVVGPNRRFPPPPEARIVAADGDLEDMLSAGDVDAFFSIRVRDQKRPEAERGLRPLLAEPQQVEADYFHATGLFPLLHVVVVHDDAAAANPLAARTIFDLFTDAKTKALARKLGTTFVPWGEPNWERTMAHFGGDPLPYGLTAANRRNAETLIRYLYDQKLIRRRPTVNELFWPGSESWITEGAKR